MKRTRLTFLLGLLLGAAVPCLSQDVTIFPAKGPTIMVPSMSSNLVTGLLLACGIEPEPYTTRWILPGGGRVNSTSIGRFGVFESPFMLTNGSTFPSTRLSIMELSYLDAGTYTCEGRSTAPGASTVWASASIELQLNLELLSNMSTINTTINDSTVALECEMRAFIRPDSSLTWEGPGGRRITDRTGKHQITFSDGTPDTAANGSASLIPSRVSTLTITNLEPSDSGIYTCRVVDIAVNINLLVDGLRKMEATDIISTTVTTTAGTSEAGSITASPSNNQIFQVVGAILGAVAVVTLILAGLLAVIVCRVFRTQRESRKVHVSIANHAGVHQPVYDYIDLPEHKLDHDHGSAGVDRRYSGLPNQVSKENDRDYDEIKDAEIYDEIRDTRERDDNYDSIKIVNTTETNCNVRIESEKSGVYEVPIGGHGTLVTCSAENDVFGVTTNEADTAERSGGADAYGGTTSQDYHDYADIDTMVDSNVASITNGRMQ